MAVEREHYRVIYPLGARPSAKISRPIPIETTVSDISEGGIRFDSGKLELSLKSGTKISGIVFFEDGSQESFSGTILRATEYDFVVKTSDESGISLPRIMTEQRILLQRFGQLKDQH